MFNQPEKVLIYCTKSAEFKKLDWPKKTRVFYANPRYFKAPERGYSAIWTDKENIRDAYAKIGVSQVVLPGESPVEEAPKMIVAPVEDMSFEEFSFDDIKINQVDESGEVVEEERDEDAPTEAVDDFPYNWRELPWFSLRSIAAQYAGGSVRDKKMAYEVMEQAEAEHLANIKGE
jgi:hypothetical protein